MEDSQLEDVVCAKNDWPGIKLAAAHDGLPPWAGRGEIPDGSKSYIPRLTFPVGENGMWKRILYDVIATVGSGGLLAAAVCASK